VEHLNTGHCGFFVRCEQRLMWVDPLLPSSERGPQPREVVRARALEPEVTDILVSSAEPLHAHRATLRRLLPGRRLIAPSSVMAELADLASLARARKRLELFEPYAEGGVKVAALPTDGGASTSMVVQADGTSLWFVGEADVGFNTARRMRSWLGKQNRAAAVVSVDVAHPLHVFNGDRRGFPSSRVANRLTTSDCLRKAGFEVVIAGGIAFTGDLAWVNQYVAPISGARMIRELGSEGLVLAQIGRWGAVGGAAASLERLEVDTLDVATHFDPTSGYPDLRGRGPLVPDLAERLERCYRQLRAERWWTGFEASLVQWRVRLEVRELGEHEERTTVVAFTSEGPQSMDVAVEPGNCVAAVTSHGLEDLLVGRRRASELSLAGELRTSERIFRVFGPNTRRPSWVGACALGETLDANVDGLGYVPTPIALVDLLSPSAPHLAWPSRESVE